MVIFADQSVNEAVMHALEYLLCVLSRRIEVETGSKELADAALFLASASHLRTRG